MDNDRHLKAAKQAVVNSYMQDYEPSRDQILDVDEVYIVWFCYILGGWKALLSTNIQDDKYYEVTFDKDIQRVYVDTYVKEKNDSIYLEDI